MLAIHVKASGGQAKLAESIGVNQGNLSRYARGRATPGLETRIVFDDKCGIPVRAWDDPPLADAASAHPTDAKGAA